VATSTEITISNMLMIIESESRNIEALSFEPNIKENKDSNRMKYPKNVIALHISYAIDTHLLQNILRFLRYF